MRGKREEKSPSKSDHAHLLNLARSVLNGPTHFVDPTHFSNYHG